ncbi:MAG: xanthine dehydrogenase family protein molybdopterin-binding subunit, partial [Thermomicrobiales bacterium]
ARQTLLDLASKKLGVEASKLQVKEGVVSVTADATRKVSYGDLIGGQHFEQTIDDTAPLKSPDVYTIVGQPVTRIDIPGKLTAAPGDFNENARVPGMRFARILRAPAYGGKLKSWDQSVAKMPGVVAVLPFENPGDPRLERVERLETMPGDFIAVVAEREDQALRAVNILRETAEWETEDTLPITSDDLYDWLTKNGQPIGLQADYDKYLSDYKDGVAKAAQTVAATYHGPYISYGPISSAWSLVDVRDDKAEVWTATQWPFGSRWMVAQALGYATSEQVHVHGGPSSGLYGRRDDYDQEVDAEAAIISQAVGAPVRLQWSRGEEVQWSQYRPPQIVSLEAGLSDAGQIEGLWGRVWTTVRGVHPEPLIAAMAMEATPYQVGPMPLEGYNAGPLLRTGYMRNVFSGYNIFALESFMDELAEKAKVDPVEFRLNHLKDERGVAVLNAATASAGWQPHVGSSGRGMGVSFVLYTNEDGPSSAYLAYVAEVEVDKETGQIQVKKLTCAIDCGLVINPDGLTNQVEGGVIQALSWCLKEQITFDRQMVTNHDWVSYPILTFPEVPEIETIIIDRKDKPAKSIGEPVTVPVASAIANAIFDATGVRVRNLPLTPDEVKAALAGA